MNRALVLYLLSAFTSVTLAKPLNERAETHLPEDVEVYGEYFEGDMMLTDEQMEALFSSTFNGMISTKYRWPNRTVPYRFSSDHSKEQQDFIKLALEKIESISCLKFVRRTTQDDYIEIRDKGHGCSSHIGRKGGKQRINLQSNKPGRGCFRLGTIIHEFLHALGFYHMQSAYDRDDYVTIQWNNIKHGHRHNFKKYSSSYVTHFNTTYDYFSVMHYSAYAFSTNGEPTIIPHDERMLNKIGEHKKMSNKDILKLNAMYECDDIGDIEDINGNDNSKEYRSWI